MFDRQWVSTAQPELKDSSFLADYWHCSDIGSDIITSRGRNGLRVEKRSESSHYRLRLNSKYLYQLTKLIYKKSVAQYRTRALCKRHFLWQP
jgi:hypothetical protein